LKPKAIPLKEEPDESSDNLDMFFTDVGGGSMEDVAETDGLDDEDADTNATREVKLYVVESGLIIYDGSGPLTQDLLDSAGIYLLTGNNEVYLWIGKDADPEKKSSSTRSAWYLHRHLSLPSTTAIVRIHEGLETAIFKQLFAAWNEVDEDAGYTDSRIAEIHRSADEEDQVEDGELSKHREFLLESVRTDLHSLHTGVEILQRGSFKTRPQEDKEWYIEKLTKAYNRVIGKLDMYMKTGETDKATEELITEYKDRVLGYKETLFHMST